jgi:hypothetical protein
MTTQTAPVATFADASAFAALLSECDPTGPRWVADLADVMGDLDEIAIWCAEPTPPATVLPLVGCFLRGPLALGGEWDVADAEAGPDGQLYLFSLDITKSRRDDVYAVLTDPETGLAAWLADGSPVRTTDRAGVGTRGTRKWASLPAPCLVAWR